MKKPYSKLLSFALLLFSLVALATLSQAGDGSGYHPKGWVMEHGKEFEKPASDKSREECNACHGTDLSGGEVGIPCNLCHIKPKHADEFKKTHGETFLADRSKCTICHTKTPFSGLKRPMAMNCTRCHSVDREVSKFQTESHTSQVEFNTSNSMEVREDASSNRQIASNHYAGIHLTERSKQIVVNSQMRFSREWEGDINNVDLYEATFQIDNLLKNHLSLTLGRQSLVTPVDYQLMDGGTFTIKPSKWFDFSFFGGIPRHIEAGDLDGSVGVVGGASLIMKERAYTNARIDFTYERRDFSEGAAADKTKEMYAGLSLSKGISIFKLYGLGQYDLVDTLFDTATAGVEIYPFTKKIGFLLEGDYYNASRSADRQSVYTIFSVDDLWQAKAGVSLDVIKSLNLYQNFSYQTYEILEGTSRTGLNAETGARYGFDAIGLEAGLAYYFIRSYGGVLHGGKLDLYEAWTNRISSTFTADYVTYDKVTNDDSQAVEARLAASGVIAPGLTCTASAEWSHNDVFANDVRGLFGFDYVFNHKFLEIEKREAKEKED